MLLSIFNSDNFWLSLLALLIAFPALLFSLSVHEFAHGYAAYKQGDGYAKCAGRLTLNPFKHLDLVGTLMMLLVGFGWAKPVPINPYSFRNGKKSMLIVSLAGIFANIVLAIISTIILCLFVAVIAPHIAFFYTIKGFNIYIFVCDIISFIALVNLNLAIFNLIPIPPLDGYKVFRELFAGKISYNFFDNVERYSNIIMMAFLLLNINFGFIGNASYKIFSAFSNLILNLFV